MSSKTDNVSPHPIALSIAIDGPTAVGKSVIGRALAQRLQLRFCDTGLLYRAATFAVIEAGIDVEAEDLVINFLPNTNITLEWKIPEEPLVSIDGIDVTQKLRRPLIDSSVSAVAKLAPVRALLVERQRSIAGLAPVIMVGRDIGKVILSEARTKLFLDASIDERAKRRHADEIVAGRSVTFEQIKTSILLRDKSDSTGHRTIRRDQVFEDQIVIDTDSLSESEVLDRCINIYADKVSDQDV